jgi:SAM-dependent methyltransferase
MNGSTAVDKVLGPLESDHKQARATIISLMRGAFSCPVVATLADLGMTEQMLAGSFSVGDFKSVKNPSALGAIFTYLLSIDLLAKTEDGCYQLTADGRRVFQRSGGFLLLHSYREYFSNLGKLLRDEDQGLCVDRLHNVLGSGSLHSRKFFPAAWTLLRGNAPHALIDIGCGDGQFLQLACSEFPTLEIAAIDVSPIAVETTLQRLRTVAISAVTGVVASGEDIDLWLTKLPEVIRLSPCPIISMWFVVHEFSRGDTERVIRFFQQLRANFPSAEILLGEIIAIPPDLLALNRNSSIMPEYLLFHALSHQGVLSWEAWRSILDAIPYELIGEQCFDPVEAGTGQAIPSSFLWHLKPLKQPTAVLAD